MLNSEGVREGIAAPFANTFGVMRVLELVKPRVGNPGLQFANTFGVRAIHVVVEHSVQLTASRLLI